MEQRADRQQTASAGAAEDRRASLLRRVRDELLPLRGHVAAARRALDLLDRDLLPRSAGGDAYLLCGIVGPNNSGKSALFNALVGRALSPSLPAGGATRRLVGAAPPALLARLQGDPTLARFQLRAVRSDVPWIEEALQPADDPTELFTVADDGVPANVVLIDTPDFDSIVHDNRLASESLLAVADLVIAVVTRHSYQNREVVQFLRDWLAHGRSWMLVYNEAGDESVAAEHTAKLVADVQQTPLAVFWAPHSLAVQRGEEQIDVRRLARDEDDAASAGETAAAGLRELFMDVEQVADVKTRAFAASMARLRATLNETTSVLADQADGVRDLLEAVAMRTRQTASEIALAAMPAGPFVEAFRVVLDRRTNPLSRGWRRLVRGLRVRVEDLSDVLRGRRANTSLLTAPTSLGKVEEAAVRRAWPALWESLVRDFGAEQRHPARRRCPPDLSPLLDADFTEGRGEGALAQVTEALGERSAGLVQFRNACEDLIEQAIEERGFDVDIQAAADVATLAPLALAAAVIISTSGVVGVDLAVAGGGAVGTFLMDKYSHLLGSRILTQARRRWMELRGDELQSILLDACLQRSSDELRAVLERESSRARNLREIAVDLS